jgi:hypothetical protein
LQSPRPATASASALPFRGTAAGEPVYTSAAVLTGRPRRAYREAGPWERKSIPSSRSSATG